MGQSQLNSALSLSCISAPPSLSCTSVSPSSSRASASSSLYCDSTSPSPCVVPPPPPPPRLAPPPPPPCVVPPPPHRRRLTLGLLLILVSSFIPTPSPSCRPPHPAWLEFPGSSIRCPCRGRVGQGNWGIAGVRVIILPGDLVVVSAGVRVAVAVTAAVDAEAVVVFVRRWLRAGHRCC